MAISTIQPGGFYDINRDTYHSGMTSREAYEREMQYRRQQEEEYRKAQQYAYYNAAQQQQAWIGDPPKPTPKQDPKDPLSFLSKADNKILLTGEAT
jgi:hypothetical protein